MDEKKLPLPRSARHDRCQKRDLQRLSRNNTVFSQVCGILTLRRSKTHSTVRTRSTSRTSCAPAHTLSPGNDNSPSQQIRTSPTLRRFWLEHCHVVGGVDDGADVVPSSKRPVDDCLTHFSECVIVSLSLSWSSDRTIEWQRQGSLETRPRWLTDTSHLTTHSSRAPRCAQSSPLCSFVGREDVAEVHTQRQQLVEALDDAELVVSLDSNCAAGWLAKGRTEHALGRVADAALSFQAGEGASRSLCASLPCRSLCPGTQ